MVSGKTVAFRFTPDDLALLDALQEKLGIGNRTDILRLAIRKLAALEYIDANAVKPRRSKPKP